MKKRDTIRAAVVAAKDLDKLVAALPGAWSMWAELQPGYSAGRGYDDDSGGGHATRIDPWCEVHDQDVRTCRMGGSGCGGKAVPSVSDPTGEAATTRNDAMADAALAIESIRAIVHHVGRLHRALAPYATPDRTALLKLAEGSGEPGCDSCARLDAWSPEYRTGTAGGALKDPKRLCRWCYDWTLGRSELPPRDAVRRHLAGERIRIPA